MTDELERLAREATPGPSGWGWADWLTPDNHAYIAAASPDVILALLDERRVLREALERARDIARQRHKPGVHWNLQLDLIEAIGEAALQAESARAEEGPSGYLLVSEAELAAALADALPIPTMLDVDFAEEVAAAIFAALSGAAQEQGETGG